MRSLMEAPKVPGKCPTQEGAWIQITFTLDPEHYRILWERAGEERRTIPSFVRESVISLLDHGK